MQEKKLIQERLSAPVKISAVSYTNTIPFIYGINRFFTKEELELQLDIPAVCAEKVINKKVDIGLIPAAILKTLPGSRIVSGYCIGAEKKVDSVMLYSAVPLNEIKTILLDYQSRTSVELVKILCRELWKITPQFENTINGFENRINSTTAAVIIGDRTFFIRDKFPYSFDLAEGWQQLTGLPFVFACWTANTDLPETFLKKFDEALAFGVNHIADALKNRTIDGLNHSEASFYLEKRISYPLDAAKKLALNLFLQKLES